MPQVLVQAPDMDALRQLLGDLPALAAAAAQYDATVFLIEDDHVHNLTQEGR